MHNSVFITVRGIKRSCSPDRVYGDMYWNTLARWIWDVVKRFNQLFLKCGEPELENLLLSVARVHSYHGGFHCANLR